MNRKPILPSQRALFDIPRDVCYLNAASWSPLPLATQEAGRVGVARKGRPWLIDPALPGRQYERARRAAARLINAEAEDVARKQKVIPFVEDTRNILITRLADRVDDVTGVTLQFALERGIEALYQLEDSELTSHRLPDHAELQIGGERVGDRGYFYAPTVVSGLRQDDEAIQTEIFGPVITVQQFTDEDQALAWANGVQYGLA